MIGKSGVTQDACIRLEMGHLAAHWRCSVCSAPAREAGFSDLGNPGPLALSFA